MLESADHVNKLQHQMADLMAESDATRREIDMLQRQVAVMSEVGISKVTAA